MKSIDKRKTTNIRVNILSRVFLALIMMLCMTQNVFAWTCVYVSSYHKGYAWSDGIERGLRKELEGQCDLIQLDMDTIRNRDELYKIQKSQEIAKKIKQIKPDVLITSDDNAAKYLVVPFFIGGKLPVVFCGINWTVKEYGFPASNVTGMIEVVPVRPMMEWARKLTRQGENGLYIGENTYTEAKNLKQVMKVASDLGLNIGSALVDTMEDWQQAFVKATDVDFIIIGNASGISDWDTTLAKEFVRKSAGKLTLTNYDWMMPVAMLGFVEIPDEHGSWAAKTAIAIHGGLPIQRIPIIASRKWDVYENPQLLKLSGIKISEVLRARAKKYNQGMFDGRQ
jgi:ABC-type uncharacterized transport system substrate-binding protein